MENWTWGLSLTALTIIVHATGIAFMSISARRIRDQMQSEGVRRHALTITIGLSRQSRNQTGEWAQTPLGRAGNFG
jgi:hypothetical protein